LTDFVAWGAGVDYKIPWFPKAFNGASWGTSLSVDFHYSGRIPGIVRYWPVSINQVYTFEDNGGRQPYAGFCLTAATFNARANFPPGRQNTITRFGGGLILGINFGQPVY